MITVFGYQIALPPALGFLDNPFGSFAVNLLGWFLLALLLYLLFNYVLKWLAQRIPGEIEDILVEILRRPVVILTLAYGAIKSLDLLPWPARAISWLGPIFETLLILIVVRLLWRVLRDILGFYGSAWARNTDSEVDDVLIPFLNLFGPVILIVVAALLILPQWGVNVTSVLLGAGVIGLVLGLALQDTLSNIFSGMSLLIEAPFRHGDLIILPDGKLCEVQRLGLRSTALYSLDDHSTVFVPNKILANSQIVNITKPTAEQKVYVDFSMLCSESLVQAQQHAQRIAAAHPCVLAQDLSKKLPLVRKRIAEMRQEANALPAGDRARALLTDEARHYRQAVRKLTLEGKLDRDLLEFQDALGRLADVLTQDEHGGFSRAELTVIQNDFVMPAEAALDVVVGSAKAWALAPDPWAEASEQPAQIQLWQERTEALIREWDELKLKIARPRDTVEVRLDDATRQLRAWIQRQYKLRPEAWKNPTVCFRGFADGKVNLRLWFYVDNIRLEHYGRARRVTTEIARQLQEQVCVK
jgi:MscS family membrane protein